MSKALYNKYRSQTFDQLIGQKNVVDVLKNAVNTGKIANAYLFVGSRGTGKTSTARILAKALNCTGLGKDGNPCNKCSNCKSVNEGKFMDLIEIDAASNRGIDQIRELKERLEFSPSEGKFKIYIIDEVHMLTKEAFNALLKTLEEPPSHVVFMLATTDVHKLPPTILSRCQRYDLKLGSNDDIREVVLNTIKAEKITFSDTAVNIIVENAKGSYRDALSLLDVVISGQATGDNPKEVTEEEVRSILGMPDSQLIIDFVSNLLNGNGKGALDVVYKVESSGINWQQFVKQGLEILRKSLIAQITGMYSSDEVLKDADSLQIQKLIAEFIGLDRSIKFSSFPILSFELLVAQYTTGSEEKTAPSSPAPKKTKQVRVEVEKVTKVTTVEEKPTEVKIEKKIEEDDTIEEEEPSNAADESNSAEVEAGDVTTEVMKEKWSNFLEMIHSLNSPLAAILRSSHPLCVEGNVLSIQVPFEFYKERIEESKSREVINNALTELLGQAFKIHCEVNGSVRKKRKVSADVVLSNIVKAAENAEKPKPQNTAPQQGAGIRKVSKAVEEIFADM